MPQVYFPRPIEQLHSFSRTTMLNKDSEKLHDSDIDFHVITPFKANFYQIIWKRDLRASK